jgi:hypothetical protein
MFYILCIWYFLVYILCFSYVKFHTFFGVVMRKGAVSLALLSELICDKQGRKATFYTLVRLEDMNCLKEKQLFS